MDESILEDVKKLLGINKDYDAFDTDIIVAINSALMSLSQLGVGPSDPITITGYDEKWTLIGKDLPYLQALKTYIYLKARLVFDPPTQSFVLNALDNQVKEYEWRLTIQADELRRGFDEYR